MFFNLYFQQILSDIDDCLTHECVHGTCKDGENDYTCLCKAGYTGKKCERSKNIPSTQFSTNFQPHLYLTKNVH